MPAGIIKKHRGGSVLKARLPLVPPLSSPCRVGTYTSTKAPLRKIPVHKPRAFSPLIGEIAHRFKTPIISGYRPQHRVFFFAASSERHGLRRTEDRCCRTQKSSCTSLDEKGGRESPAMLTPTISTTKGQTTKVINAPKVSQIIKHTVSHVVRAERRMNILRFGSGREVDIGGFNIGNIGTTVLTAFLLQLQLSSANRCNTWRKPALRRRGI